MTSLEYIIKAAAFTFESENDIIALNDLLDFYKRMKNSGHDPAFIMINDIELEMIK